jgi:hypothetical protein
VASIKAVTAAMVASPAIFLVAAAAIVTAVALIAGSVMKVQKNAEAAKKLVTEVEESSAKRRGVTAEQFERDQERADTLRGNEKTEFDQKRLEKVQEQVRESVKSRKEVEERLKKLTTFSWTSQIGDTLGFSQRVKVTTAAVEARKSEEAQAKEERDNLEEEMLLKPQRDIAALHKNLDEDTMLVGLKGTDRELKKIENSLQKNIALREFYVENLFWDEEEEEVVKLDKAIADTTRELNRYKDAISENKGAHAVQETKDKVDSLAKSLEETVTQLKYVGDEWELYRMKSEALGRGAEMTSEQETRLKTLLEDKKILQERKKLKEESEQLTKKFRSPAEKFREDMTRLQEVQREDPLDDLTFAKAAEEITKEFNKAEKAIQSAKIAVTQFDAAVIGTSESARRIEKYREQYEMMKNAADKPPIVMNQRQKTSEESFAQETVAPAINNAIKGYQEFLANPLGWTAGGEPSEDEDESFEDVPAGKSPPKPGERRPLLDWMNAAPKEGERLPLAEWLQRTGQGEAAGLSTAMAPTLSRGTSVTSPFVGPMTETRRQASTTITPAAPGGASAASPFVGPLAETRRQASTDDTPDSAFLADFDRAMSAAADRNDVRLDNPLTSQDVRGGAEAFNQNLVVPVVEKLQNIWDILEKIYGEAESEEVDLTGAF